MQGIELDKIYYAVFSPNTSCFIAGGPFRLFNNFSYITDDEEKARSNMSVFCSYVKIKFVIENDVLVIKENFTETSGPI